MQVRTALIVVAIVVGLVAWLAFAPSGTPGGSGAAGAAEVAGARVQHHGDAREPGQHEHAVASRRRRSTSSFPSSPSTAWPARKGFSQDKEYNEQIPAINLYVNQINKSGGINGRKINPIIVQFDPTNDANQQALCRQWTEGSPAVFAVVDGIGTWYGRQPAVRGPAGADPAPQCVVDHHRLDQPGLAVPVVDRARTWRRCWRRPCSGG